MTTWRELNARRWAWSMQAQQRLQRELFGLADAVTATQAASVMVVGDTQSGKTTLLIRLLGVRPDAADRVDRVLRAGREAGRSSTSFPCRYRFSDHPDRWLLSRGPDDEIELDDEGMRAALVRFRGRDGDTPTWDVDSRPLEVGLPRDLADGRLGDLDIRVLDLPGLHARNEQEQAIARALVERFAPTMTMVIFVQLINKISDASSDPAIADSEHLNTWMDEPDRFALVLTHAFYNQSVQESDAFARLRAGAGPAEIADHLRRFLATELFPDRPDRAARFAASIFPIDIGRSIEQLRASVPDLVPGIEATVELTLTQLRELIRRRSGTEYWQRAAPALAARVLSLTRNRVRAHARQVAEAELELAARQRRRDELAGLLELAEDAMTEATRRVAALDRERDRLTAASVHFSPPASPPLTGEGVRSAQPGEVKAWYESARAAWSQWLDQAARAAAGLPRRPAPPVTQDAVHTHYTKTVGCCGVCTESGWSRFWSFGDKQKPEHCLSAMRGADAEMREWITQRLREATATVRVPLAGEVMTAQGRLAVTRQEHTTAVGLVESGRERLAELRRELTQAEADVAAVTTVAGRVGALLNDENRAQFTGLLRDLVRAPAEHRPWIAVAAARTLLDLDETMRKR